MGKVIESLAIEKGHQIVGRYTSANPFNLESYIDADIAIEFTHPILAIKHIETAIHLNLPIVIGTTGWYENFDTISKKCIDAHSAIFTATNFSLGVNLYFEMSAKLTRLMEAFNYKASISEIHHIEKKDAPSGTAITLAETVIKNSSKYNQWALTNNEVDKTISIEALREEGVPGTHILRFENDIDILKFEHEAKSRVGFAAGAILAAEWLVGKTGVYGMSDLLNFEN